MHAEFSLRQLVSRADEQGLRMEEDSVGSSWAVESGKEEARKTEAAALAGMIEEMGATLDTCLLWGSVRRFRSRSSPAGLGTGRVFAEGCGFPGTQTCHYLGNEITHFGLEKWCWKKGVEPSSASFAWTNHNPHPPKTKNIPISIYRICHFPFKDKQQG